MQKVDRVEIIVFPMYGEQGPELIIRGVSIWPVESRNAVSGTPKLITLERPDGGCWSHAELCPGSVIVEVNVSSVVSLLQCAIGIEKFLESLYEFHGMDVRP